MKLQASVSLAAKQIGIDQCSARRSQKRFGKSPGATVTQRKARVTRVVAPVTSARTVVWSLRSAMPRAGSSPSGALAFLASNRDAEVRHSLGFPADFAGSETAALVSHLLILLPPGSPTTPASAGMFCLSGWMVSRDRLAGDKAPGAVDFRFPVEMKTTGNSMGAYSYGFQKNLGISNTRSRLGD